MTETATSFNASYELMWLTHVGIFSLHVKAYVSASYVMFLFSCRKNLVNLWDVLDKKEDNRNNGSTRNLLSPPATKMASFWEKTNANAKCSGTYEWTSLIGSDKTSLMELLQTQLEQIKWHHLPRNQATSDKALVRFPSTFQNHEWLWTQSWTAAWRCPKWKRIHQPVYSSL